jgi:hypothetical protein
MWRLRCNATNAQIAETLGIIVGKDDYGRQVRSATATNYIKRGEEVLKQAGFGPDSFRLYPLQSQGSI